MSVPTLSRSADLTRTRSGFAFRGVTVIDVSDGRRLSDQTVVVVGNRIQAVGPTRTVRLPKDVQVINAGDKYLIPGLWDMHTHPGRSGHLFYPLFIAHGVTGIRDAGSEVSLDTLAQWKRDIAVGARVGPRLIVSGPAINERKLCERLPLNHQTCAVDTTDVRHLVDSLRSAGADMIKTYDMSQPVYFALAAEARRLAIPFGGHIQGSLISAAEASDSGARLIEHINTSGGLDTLCIRKAASLERCRLLAERFRHNGTWWVPTLFIGAAVGLGGGGPRSWPINAEFFERVRVLLSDSVLNRYSVTQGYLDDMTRFQVPHDTPQSAAESVGTMHLIDRAGLPIVAGTDTHATELFRVPPGLSLHAELEMYVAEGLPPLAALQSATLNAARVLQATDSLGTVAPGKVADLVLLDANPLENIKNLSAIRAVVANGRYFDRAALDQLVAEVRTAVWKNPL